MRLLLLMTYLANTVWGQMYVRTDTTFIHLSTLDVDLIRCSRSCEKDPACTGFYVDASRCINLAPGTIPPATFVSFRKAGSQGSCPAGTNRWQKVFGTDTKGPKADQSSSPGTTAFTTQGNGVDSGAKTAPSTTTGAPSTATTTSGSGPRESSEAKSGTRSSDSTITSVQPASYPVDNGIPSTGTIDGNGAKTHSEPSGATSSPFTTTTSITSAIMTSSSSQSSTTKHLTPGMISLGDILSSTLTMSKGTDGGAKDVTEAVSGIGSMTTVSTATTTATGATSVLPTTTAGPTTVDSTTPKVLTTTTRATTKPGAHSPTTTGQTTGTVSLPTIAPTTPASSETSAVPDSTLGQTTMTSANGSGTTNGTDETTMEPCVPCPKKGRGVRLYVPTSMMITPITCNYCPVAHG